MQDCVERQGSSWRHKHAILCFVRAHPAFEMAADLADRPDLSFIFVQQNVVVIDPAGDLAGPPHLVNRGEVPEVSPL